MSEIRTSCRDCVFAEFTSCSGRHLQDWGSVQEGCKAGRLKKFNDLGLVETIYPQDEDETWTTYQEIQGFCNLCRNREWSKKHRGKDLLAQARNEAKQKIDIVVAFDKLSILGDLRLTCQSIASQTFKPETVTIVAYGTKSTPLDCLQIAQTVLRPKGVEPTVEMVADADIEEWEAISLGIRRGTGNYYVLCLAGHEFQPNFLASIERKINDELVRLLAVEPDNLGNGLVVSRRLHQLLTEKGYKNIAKGIDDLIKSEECKNQILTTSQLLS